MQTRCPPYNYRSNDIDVEYACRYSIDNESLSPTTPFTTKATDSDKHNIGLIVALTMVTVTLVTITVVVAGITLYKCRRQPNRNEDSDSEPQIDNEDSTENENIPSDLDWCSCENCTIMPTARECKCCNFYTAIVFRLEEASVKCITQHEGFVANCLNRLVLETSFYEYLHENGPLDENELIHKVYRHLAYRRFVRWIWQRLGKNNRRILPSCVVNKIRTAFPSQQYCGFKYPSGSLKM